jgi:hypothetical protein
VASLSLLKVTHYSVVIFYSSRTVSYIYSALRSLILLAFGITIVYSEDVDYSIKKYINNAKSKLSIANRIIVTSHLQCSDVIIRFDKKNPKMLPTHDIDVHRPIDDPSFLECQCLLISANTVCQAAKCEKPYPTIDTAIAMSNETILLSLVMW